MFQKAIVMTMTTALLAAGANAATLEFSHGDPAKFIDIRETDGSQDKFEQKVLTVMEAEFRKQAEKLPADQVLKVNLKDLDLAGTIEYFEPRFPFGVRVIREVDFPSMELHYELLGANKQVVKSGDEKFSDLGFRDDVLVLNDLSEMKYEKRMIREWFRRTLSPPPVTSRN